MQKEVIIPIYDAMVCLFVNATTEQFVDHLKQTYNIDEEVIHCKGLVNSRFSTIKQRKIFYVYISSKMDYKDYFNTVGHELFHLTQEILEDRGEYFKRRDSNESYAYLQGYMLGENYDYWNTAYKKFNRVIKK